jgi:hypothetical protein
MKKLSWTIFIAALLITIALIAAEQYYVAVALVVGVIIMMHRELWSLITRRKLPPVDERVKENTTRAVRNGFIYFAAVTAILMLPFTIGLTRGRDTIHVLAGLFLSAGLVYLISYLYYDRAQPRMSEKLLKLLKRFLQLAALSVAAFIVFVFLHNMLYALLGVEEPVFFILSVIVSPLALAVGLVGSLVVFIIGLARKIT